MIEHFFFYLNTLMFIGNYFSALWFYNVDEDKKGDWLPDQAKSTQWASWVLTIGVHNGVVVKM